MVYNEHFVAFLDILGFKSIIDATAKNSDECERIFKVLNYIAKVRTENYDNAKGLILNDVSVFSDSIVISYPVNLSIGGALFHVLMDIVFICIDLLSAGIFVRGGVTCGQMYHDKNICFGPAMIKAYKLESEVAKYPRVVVDECALKMGLKYPGCTNSVDLEEEFLLSLLCSDEAGIFYLDFLSQRQEYDDDETYICGIRKARRCIKEQLAKNHPPQIQEKYIWFAEYYNRTVKKLFRKPYVDELKISLPKGDMAYGVGE